MRPKSSQLVDALVIGGFIKLNVCKALPILARLIIIARPFGIRWIKENSRNQNTLLITKQIQRIGTKRYDRQPMCVATQRADKITIGHHLAHTVVVFIKHCSTNYYTMLN